MRYAFFGTPNFAAIILGRLIEAGMPPMALICNPDRPAGRKQVITPPETKQLIANGKWQIEILQPEDILTIRNKLSAISPDFFIVAAYARILPKEILDIPRLCTVGVHPSLLPKFRGPSPIQSAILTGEKETGVSLFLMDDKVDHGPIIGEQKTSIGPSAYSYELTDRLAEVSAELLIETLPKFVRGKITPLTQDEALATYTKKFTGADGFVSSEDLEVAANGKSLKKAIEISRKIRALNPEPGVWTLRPFNEFRAVPSRVEGRHAEGKQQRVKLLEAKLIDSRLQLTRIQKEGKTPSLLS